MAGVEVIAEGVETREQLEFLKTNECFMVQGFYFYKPMPAGVFEAVLEQSSERIMAGSGPSRLKPVK